MIPRVTVQALLDRQSAGKHIGKLFSVNGVMRIEYTDGEAVDCDDLGIGEGDQCERLASLVSSDRNLPLKEVRDYLSSVKPDIKTGLIWLPEAGFWD